MSALRHWDSDPASPRAATAATADTDAPDPAVLRAVAPGVPTARRGPFVMVMLLLLGGGLTGLLLLNTQLQQGTFSLSTLQADEGSLTDQAQSLGLQADAMQAPGALQSAAAALGMVPAADPQFLDLTRQRLSSAPAITGAPVPLTAAQIAQAKADAAARAAVARAAARSRAAAAREKAAAEAAARAKARAAAAAAAARAKASASASASAPAKSAPVKPTAPAKPTAGAPARATGPATPTSPARPTPKATP